MRWPSQKWEGLSSLGSPRHRSLAFLRGSCFHTSNTWPQSSLFLIVLLRRQHLLALIYDKKRLACSLRRSFWVWCYGSGQVRGRISWALLSSEGSKRAARESLASLTRMPTRIGCYRVLFVIEHLYAPTLKPVAYWPCAWAMLCRRKLWVRVYSWLSSVYPFWAFHSLSSPATQPFHGRPASLHWRGLQPQPV